MNEMSLKKESTLILNTTLNGHTQLGSCSTKCKDTSHVTASIWLLVLREAQGNVQYH